MGKTYNKNDQSITTKVGETFSIELEGNPTAGYQWQENVDEKKVKLLDRQVNLSSKEIASAATEVLTFQALTEGTTILHFDYKRAWEKERLEAVAMKVTIQKND